MMLFFSKQGILKCQLEVRPEIGMSPEVKYIDWSILEKRDEEKIINRFSERNIFDIMYFSIEEGVTVHALFKALKSLDDVIAKHMGWTAQSWLEDHEENKDAEDHGDEIHSLLFVEENIYNLPYPDAEHFYSAYGLSDRPDTNARLPFTEYSVYLSHPRNIGNAKVICGASRTVFHGDKNNTISPLFENAVHYEGPKRTIISKDNSILDWSLYKMLRCISDGMGVYGGKEERESLKEKIEEGIKDIEEGRVIEFDPKEGFEKIRQRAMEDLKNDPALSNDEQLYEKYHY